MWRADSLEKTLILVNIEVNRRRGQRRMRWLDDITSSMDMSLSKFPELVMGMLHSLLCYIPWSYKESDTTERLHWNVFLSNLRKLVFNHIILAKRTHVLGTWIWLSISVEMHILVIIQLLEDWPVLHFFLLLVTVKHTQGENSQRMHTSTS